MSDGKEQPLSVFDPHTEESAYQQANRRAAEELEPLAKVVARNTDNNPKAARALLDGKAPMELIPYKPLAAVARVLAGGAMKYGKRNWQIEAISATTYVGAITRHTLLEWAEGVDEDADSGEHPLAHVIASCLLVMDAQARGKLIDDRLMAQIIRDGKVIEEYSWNPEEDA